ncbi:MAG: hypothetical protein EOO07_00045 [Chitinophagaceae bacterium]|nr:MAG: hypothetical protein EOO07_00045 [Chitinophagaceae bacterium]
MYYHTKEDSRYISELKKALIETGAYEDEDKSEPKKLVLKEEFKQTDFYKFGRVVFNKRIPRIYENVRSIADLGVSKKNYKHILASGFGKMTSALQFEMEVQYEAEVMRELEMKLSTIPKHIIQYALAKNPFFYFNNLERYFPSLQSLSKFIESEDYLGSLAITFGGTRKRLDEITHDDYLLAILQLLQTIEIEIKSNLTVYQGSEYVKEYVHNVFKDKEIRVPKDSERANGQEAFLLNEAWYVYTTNYGTSEEKEFVKMFARRFEDINQKFKDIYLIRNEREVKIIDKLGRAFEPDFILFCKQKDSEELTYQVFIEPKGKHLIANDKWKEGFLSDIKDANKIIKIDTDKYKITGVPFYNYDNENEFKTHLENTLDL